MKTKRIVALEARRDTLKTELEKLDDLVIERGSDLTEDEQSTYDAHETELTEVAGTLKTLIEREARIGESIVLGAQLGVAANTDGGKPGTPGDGEIYRARDKDPEHDPIVDLIARANGDEDAGERIRKHNSQRRNGLLLRASGTSDLGGLIVPAYMTEDFAPIARELKPFANAMQSRPLTSFTIVIGRATVGAAVAAQATQNSPFTTANVASEPITLTPSTIAGVAELSVQAVDFSAYDTATLNQDIFEAYWSSLDYDLFHGTGGAGTVEGVLNADGVNTVNGATVDTFEELYVAVVEAAAEVRTAIKAPATHVVMSSMRWYSLLAETDSDGRPIMGWQGSAPQNVPGTWDGQTFAGLRVIVDDNIVASGGDDTKVIVCRISEYRLYESNGGNPQVIRIDQAKAAEGTVQFVGRGYAAFTAERRPGATTVIQNLPEPTFPGNIS